MVRRYPVFVLAALVIRKRSPRRGIHAFLAWTVAGAGLFVGFFRLRPGPAPHAGGA